MSEHTENGSEGESKDHEGSAFVIIKVNAVDVKIRRGSQTGAEIKKAAGCPSSHLLKRAPGLELVGNEERVTIKGGEQFVCHPQIGQAS